MKKILAIILCIVLSLGCLVGCSSFNEETEETKEIFGVNETGETIPLSESTVIKDINSKIQKLIGEVDASKENKEEVSKDIARLQCNTNALFRNDKKLESKDEELSKKDEEFEVISNDLKAVTDVLKEKAENLQSEIDGLKVTDEELAAKDVELDEAITSIWETLPKILNDFFNWRVKPELKKLEMNINRRLDNLTWRLVGDEKQIKENKKNIATNKEGISGNKTALDDQATTISRHGGLLNEHSEDILNLTGRIEALEALDIENRLEELELFKDTYAEKHFPKITSSIKDLQSEIEKLKEEINKLKTEPGESGGGE